MQKKTLKLGRRILNKSGRSPKLNNIWQLIIWQLIKNPNDLSRHEWARETKIAKELYESVPDIDFWGQLKMTNEYGKSFYLNSLAFLKRQKGQKILKEKRSLHASSKKLSELFNAQPNKQSIEVKNTEKFKPSKKK
jgi:hypothetical protein